MGNYRFKLSDMMPNAWFYKLREIGSRNHPTNPNHKTKPQQQTAATSAKTKQPHHSYPRKSYHFTRDLNPPETLIYTFPDPPRKSSKQRTFRKKQSSPQSHRTVSVLSSAGCGCRARPHSPPEYSASSSSFSSSDSSPETEFRSDSVLATKSGAKFDDLGLFPELELPRIITKSSKAGEAEEDATKTEHVKKATSPAKEDKRINAGGIMAVPARKSNGNCPSGVRLRVNSPRLAASRKIQGHAARRSSLSRKRRSLSDSFAVVKSSADPQKDFRESMVEMIVENNIRGSKELEDLLACYLSLNSEQYHHLIIKVFKQIWFDLSIVKCL